MFLFSLACVRGCASPRWVSVRLPVQVFDDMATMAYDKVVLGMGKEVCSRKEEKERGGRVSVAGVLGVGRQFNYASPAARNPAFFGVLDPCACCNPDLTAPCSSTGAHKKLHFIFPALKLVLTPHLCTPILIMFCSIPRFPRTPRW